MATRWHRAAVPELRLSTGALLGGGSHRAPPADGLARRGSNRNALDDEIAYLSALQSLSPTALRQQLSKTLGQQPYDRNRGLDDTARELLEAAVPTAFKAPPQDHGGMPRSPMPAELHDIVNRIHRDGAEQTRGAINRLISEQRQYYEQTGDGYYPVRCVERLSNACRTPVESAARA